jgi:hypothetical protein
MSGGGTSNFSSAPNPRGLGAFDKFLWQNFGIEPTHLLPEEEGFNTNNEPVSETVECNSMVC